MADIIIIIIIVIIIIIIEVPPDVPAEREAGNTFKKNNIKDQT